MVSLAYYKFKVRIHGTSYYALNPFRTHGTQIIFHCCWTFEHIYIYYTNQCKRYRIGNYWRIGFVIGTPRLQGKYVGIFGDTKTKKYVFFFFLYNIQSVLGEFFFAFGLDFKRFGFYDIGGTFVLTVLQYHRYLKPNL